jgi:hypothetical protein
LKVHICTQRAGIIPCRSYLNGTLEQIQGGLLIVAGGLGLIALILVIFEVVFRCCLKPTPMVPRLVALLALLQFIALGGMVIVLLGSNGWKTPPGTSFGPTLWANIIGIAAAFVAFVLMWLAAIAEKKAYKGRFKVCFWAISDLCVAALPHRLANPAHGRTLLCLPYFR